MDRLLQDLRYAVRTLTAQKGFTLVVVLTLALAVAANSTIFTMIHALMFRALPLDRGSALGSAHRATLGCHGDGEC